MSVEEWREVAGYPRFEVSSLGRVRNSKTGRVLKPMWTGQKRKQYATVRYTTSPRIDFKVHTLVLEAFIGPRPEGLVGRHGDDDTRNNAASNLSWGTSAQNRRDCSHPDRHAQQKITRAQAVEIRHRREAGESGKKLASEFGISQQLVCGIFKGIRHVS